MGLTEHAYAGAQKYILNINNHVYYYSFGIISDFYQKPREKHYVCKLKHMIVIIPP